MAWKKTNLSRIRNSSPDKDRMSWKMSRGAVGSTQTGASRFTFEPGARMPFGHRHREQEEVYMVISGGGRFRLDGEDVEVTEGDVIRVDPETWRGYEAGPDGLDLICVGGERPKGNDSEQDEDFWD